ncbi:thermospermine synthase ACAULIS5 isoform X2 [Benincasa hispida]|uniref:thermospermine synthase ACAULIS5 isoform X2 n=1 Tax=Benincasa hispida TaxID=102211 RepID=UPI0019025CBF|nr:thermospermine synthase ACAULIS5 isoform X2 [Benincasa hispida]
MGPAVLSSHTNGFSQSVDRNFEEKSNYINGANSSHESVINNVNGDDCHWYEEIIDENLKWSFALNSPKTVFIMGGGEGSAAREVLKHKSIEKVVMCDIDQDVVDFCRKHLTVNRETFCHSKLHLVINDARAELEKRREKYDIIIGDLADPVKDGPCYKLYTKSFYHDIVKPKLHHNGIFVTQAGPAGIFTHKEVFTSIYNTIKQTFNYVIAYTAYIPSFADTWGWVMASDHPFCIKSEELDKRIEDRINGELLYLTGPSIVSSTILNKMVSLALLNETHIYTEATAKFIHGQGVGFKQLNGGSCGRGV